MIKDIVKNLEVSSTLRINEISKKLESEGKEIFKFGRYRWECCNIRWHEVFS